MESLRPLAVWINANGGRPDFARKVGCSEPHLSEILSGSKQASLKLAVKIACEANNVVPVEAFVVPTRASEAAE